MNKPPRKKNPSPTSLTLKFLRDRGIPARVVEKWLKIGNGGVRKDVWGADIQFLTKDAIVGIQAGAGQHHGPKVKYAITHPEVKQWLSHSYARFHVWTWSLKPAFNQGGDRRKKDKWTPRVTEIYREYNGKILARPFVLAGTE